MADGAAGVAVGEAAKRLGRDPVWPMTLLATLAMFVAVGFGVQPVLMIHAGASTILMGSTRERTGYTRLQDAAVNTALGLLGSQVR